MMSGFQLNFGPLKEPLGFIKVLEWFFSIFSFATCGGYSGETSLFITCVANNQTVNKSMTAAFGYPFRLNTITFKGIDDLICGRAWTPFHLSGDYSSPSQFYVTIAVLAFLYSMGALVLYLGFKHLYQAKVPLIDFLITVVFAFMWLVSSSAWAKGLTDVKYVTNPEIITKYECNQTSFYTCHPAAAPHLGSLNISVAFGFLNLILWAGNAWFVYKETNLHTSPTENLEQGPPPTTAHIK